MRLTRPAQAFIELLKIAHPIIQAPMAGNSTPRMAAAVSNAGALGSISVGAMTPANARKSILEYRALSSKPLNVNVFCHRPSTPDLPKAAAWLERLRPEFEQVNQSPPERLSEIYKSFIDDELMLSALLETRPEVVSFHFGLPSPAFISNLKQAGSVLLGSATSLEEALQLQENGIDAAVAQGYEAGGHRGIFDLASRDERYSTSVLVRLLAPRLDIPVVAAGGLMTGQDVAGALRNGAAAAQLGTAFLATDESAADIHFRKLLLGADSARHTVMTRAISGRPARCLANRFTEIGLSVDPADVPDYPLAYDAGKSLHQAALKAGQADYGAYWAGQGAPFIRTMSSAELVKTLVNELAAA